MPSPSKQAALFFFLILPSMLFAQNENKIDLPFRILIAKQKTADSIAHKKGPSAKTQWSKHRHTGTVTRKYNCIIYTSNPAALRKKGITVQSELPAFVTALATLQQIEQAAAMPEVNFIEAPEYLKTHNK